MQEGGEEGDDEEDGGGGGGEQGWRLEVRDQAPEEEGCHECCWLIIADRKLHLCAKTSPSLQSTVVGIRSDQEEHQSGNFARSSEYINTLYLYNN